MGTLSPALAAKIAEGVYRLRVDAVSEVRAQRITLGSEQHFSIQEDSRFTGRSGAMLWKPLTGFGYISAGTGLFSGEALCATRGTHMSSKADWASNFNVGLQSSPSGLPVHAGFNEVWKSFSPSLDQFLQSHKPSHVHCVGHSLGGALAMLNADYFLNRGIPVSIYTFGAPRTGGTLFSASMSRRVPEARIYRVSHIADPVPMIPVFPFIHMPFNAPAMVIGEGYRGAAVDANMHSMEEVYVPMVSKFLDWGNLPKEGGFSNSKDAVAWLERPDGACGIKMYSAHGLRMIGNALAWILKKAGKLLAIGINITATAALTLPDMVAYLISKGAQVSKEIGTYSLALVRGVLRFLGRAATTAVDLTSAFLRWVFDMLLSTLTLMARAAIGRRA